MTFPKPESIKIRKILFLMRKVIKFGFEVPDDRIRDFEDFHLKVEEFILQSAKDFGFILLPDTSSWGMEAKVLHLLGQYSPQSLSQIQRKLGIPMPKVYDTLVGLVNSGRVILFQYSRGRGRPGTWYGVRNARNLQPYWDKFFQVLSDGKIHERDVVLELTGAPIPSPEAKFLEWTAITYDNVVAEAGEYEGKFRFVYFLKGSEGERIWREKMKPQTEQMGVTPLSKEGDKQSLGVKQ